MEGLIESLVVSAMPSAVSVERAHVLSGQQSTKVLPKRCGFLALHVKRCEAVSSYAATEFLASGFQDADWFPTSASTDLIHGLLFIDSVRVLACRPQFDSVVLQITKDESLLS